VLSHLVLGAMCEAVALVASAGSPRLTVRKVIAELRACLEPHA
jgi:hypothetical protein